MPSREFLNRRGSIWERTNFTEKDLPTLRAEMEARTIADIKTYTDVSWVPGTLGTVSGKWIKPAQPVDGVLYYVHGGGFTLGSSGIPLPFLMELSHRLQIVCFSADYPLAPESTFPAAPDTAFAGYHALLESGYSPDRIILCGESAGATLVLDIPLMAKNAGLPVPCAVISLSPVTDATAPTEGTVLDGLDNTDQIYNIYAPGYDKSHPLISPALGDLRQYPDVFLLAGGAEVLMNDTLIFAERAAKQGVDVRVTIGKDMIHTYPLDLWDYPEAMIAFEEIELYIRQKLRLH